MSVALATQLREGTKKSHTMAENTGFVSCFLKGVVDKASYRTLVADLYFVYSAMEEEIGKLKADVAKQLHKHALVKFNEIDEVTVVASKVKKADATSKEEALKPTAKAKK